MKVKESTPAAEVKKRKIQSYITRRWPSEAAKLTQMVSNDKIHCASCNSEGEPSNLEEREGELHYL